MLDLNLEADSACDETDTDPCKTTASVIGGDDSGTSITAFSSVVYADDPPSSVAAAEDDDSNSSSRTLTDGGCYSLCTLNFSILKSDQVIEVEEESNGEDVAIMKQLSPVAGISLSSTLGPAPPLSQSWLNLSVLESGGGAEMGICKPTKVQLHQPIKKSRRGPRSRSSQYRGVTFYRRTGRWESHIWDCGKQVYLGGFDTAHFAARAYDRAALKFRGVDADINFHISDYEEDMKHIDLVSVDLQMKKLTKEEFVQILRRRSTGFSKGSSRYRGVTLHKCGRWEARIGQFLEKKDYDKAAIKCNGREAVTNFEASAYEGEMETRDGGAGNSLDLKLWISPPVGGPKGPDNTRNLECNCGARETPVLKRVNVFFTNAYPSQFSYESSYTAVDNSPATPHGPAMASKYSIRTGMHSGLIPNNQEQLVGMRAEATPAPAFSTWQWKMQSQGVVTSVPQYSSAASSGFSSTTTSLSHPLVPLNLHLRHPQNHHLMTP